jgi:hypothetical protein
MRSTRQFTVGLILTALVAAAIGFGASYVWDSRAIQKIAAQRDAAVDCRRSGATVAPCPVVYRNTRTEWRDRIETVRAPDPKQTERIASLSAELAQTRRTVRNLERRRSWPRAIAAYGWQNGTRQYPYNTDERCPAGSVVVYDAGLSASGTTRRRSGDPDVCYIRTALYSSRFALPSQRH